MKPNEISRLESFARCAGDKHWRIDSNALVDLVYCSLRDGCHFRLKSRGQRDGVVYCKLEWLGTGYDWPDVMRDFWCDFLSGADRDLFISRRTTGGEPGLFIIAGDQDHGHVVQIDFVGERIEMLIKSCALKAC